MRYGFILFETNTYAYISMFYSFQIFQETVRRVKGILMEILTQTEREVAGLPDSIHME